MTADFVKRFLKPMSPAEPLSPYSGGFDCGLHGANTTNCHFSLFSTPARTAQWERGKRDGEKIKARVESGEPRP